MALPQQLIDDLSNDYAPILAEFELFSEQVQTRPETALINWTTGNGMVQDLRGFAAKLQSYSDYLVKQADIKEGELGYLPRE